MRRAIEIDLYDDYMTLFKPIDVRSIAPFTFYYILPLFCCHWIQFKRGVKDRQQYKFFLLHFVHLMDDKDSSVKFALVRTISISVLVSFSCE